MVSTKVITVEMLLFKEATRHIWNAHYSKLDDQILLSDGFIGYEKIEKSLFWAIVVAPSDILINVDEYRKHPLKCIELRIKDIYRECPIKIGRQAKNGNVIWSDTALISPTCSYKFLFFDFFDWNPYGFVDQIYIRFWIESLSNNDSSYGQWGLVETGYVDFYFLGE